MRRYRAVEKLGEGSFACVHKCVLVDASQSTEPVAVKQLKTKVNNWEECKRLREVQALTKLKHENIIKCTEVIFERSHELFLVFEFAPRNLWQIITDTANQALSVDRIRSLSAQLLDGLAHMHKHGIFHRDIKPENLLIREEPTADGRSHEVLKIADFGCMRDIRSRPPFTVYVATRWYRAPELLLHSTVYSSPVDIWAAGVIFGEMFARTNLFPGQSDVDTIHLIYSKLGTPKKENMRRDSSRNLLIPSYPAVPIATLFAGTELEHNQSAQQLFVQLLTIDPSFRATATKAREHPFFAGFKMPTLGVALQSPKKIDKDREPLTARTQHGRASSASFGGAGRHSGDEEHVAVGGNDGSSHDDCHGNVKGRGDAGSGDANADADADGGAEGGVYGGVGSRGVDEAEAIDEKILDEITREADSFAQAVSNKEASERRIPCESAATREQEQQHRRERTHAESEQETAKKQSNFEDETLQLIDEMSLASEAALVKEKATKTTRADMDGAVLESREPVDDIETLLHEISQADAPAAL